MSAADILIIVVFLPLAVWFIGIRGGLSFMHAYWKRPIPWKLNQTKE